MRAIDKLLKQQALFDKACNNQALKKVSSVNRALEKTTRCNGIFERLNTTQENSSVEQAIESLNSFTKFVDSTKINTDGFSMFDDYSSGTFDMMAPAGSGNGFLSPKSSNANFELSGWHRGKELNAIETTIERLNREKEELENACIPLDVFEESNSSSYSLAEIAKRLQIPDFEEEKRELVNTPELDFGDILADGIFNFLGLICLSIREDDIKYINRQINALERRHVKVRSSIRISDDGTDSRKRIRAYSKRLPLNSMDEENIQIISTNNTEFLRNLIWKSNGTNYTINTYQFAA
jgi:uncharacterized protein (UPF0335 family)